MDSTTRMAVELVDEAIDFADELQVAVHHLDDEAVVLDFGHEAAGGIEAGLLLAEIATGGLATVQTRVESVAGATVPHVELSTDHPLRALLGVQHAGWRLDVGGTPGAGSGPARLLAGEGGFVDRLPGDERDRDADFAVLSLEAGRLPDEEVAREVADRTGVPTSGVFLASAPVASLAGSVAMAARAAEVAVFRLAHLGYDPGDVVTATASAPIAPVAGDERTAIVRTNDAIAHGARAHLVAREGWDRFDELPAAATDAPPFDELLDEDRDFAAAEHAFAPAAATVDVVGGPTAVVGGIDEAVLAERLGLCG